MEEKRRILKMIEEGKITSEEGLRLLEAIGEEKNHRQKPSKEDSEFFDFKKSEDVKMLYIRVLDSDGSKIKVNIPLEFIKIMGGLSSVKGVDLDKYNLDVDKLFEAIENGFIGRLVEIESEEGEKILIEIA